MMGAVQTESSTNLPSLSQPVEKVCESAIEKSEGLRGSKMIFGIELA